MLQTTRLHSAANMESPTPEVELPKPRDPLTRIIFEIITPVVLVAVVLVVLYKLIKRFTSLPVDNAIPELPRLRKDMTVAELRHYDGTQEDNRVLVAVNGWIFDVTRGKRFYGPGECISMRCL